MYQNIYQILQNMQSFINNQDQKIQSLQNQIQLLEKTVSELEKRPPVHIDRMEYKFDQLKVETLEGTLNIGLNPSDLQGIEDLSLPNHQNNPLPPNERMSLHTEIENEINHHLDNNLDTTIENACQQLQFQPDMSYHDFILQDLKRQLPNRIESYLNQPLRDGMEQKQQKEWILDQLKKEIQQGVLTFLQHLPNNMNGGKPT